MEIEKKIQINRQLIHDHLNGLFSINIYKSRAADAARYMLLSESKKLRPLLTIAVAEALGSSLEKSISTACAIEMIHTYSLIHDDLPCMDDDDFRRGKPSVHKAFDEAHAVLAGDLLLTFAFQTIASDSHISSDQKAALIDLIASHSGDNGLIGGQSLDLLAEKQGQQLSLEALQTIHYQKTGALITAAVLSGAIIGNASKEQRGHLENFATVIGIAFQIIDDVLDASSSNDPKASFVTLLGVDKAEKAADDLLEKALSELEASQLACDELIYLANLLVCRTT